MPICVLLYFLSFLDRTNISQAQIFVGRDGHTMNDDLGGFDYQIALTVLYHCTLSLNMILKKVGPQLCIPGLVAAWGIVTTLQGVVQSGYGLYINRIFLGLAEAGILPGIAVYLGDFLHARRDPAASGGLLYGCVAEWRILRPPRCRQLQDGRHPRPRRLA